MIVALTGATGFLGRYIGRTLMDAGHECRAWYRPESDRSGFEPAESKLQWVQGSLEDAKSVAPLLEGCDVVVHGALFRPGDGFRGAEGNVLEFLERNFMGSLRLMEAAHRAGIKRFVFISSCAVHERILNDRPLDEAHPLWPTSHYGAHKAAIEKFVHSYGLGYGFPICALRPTGIYGMAHRLEQSKWFDLISRVARGEDVHCERGGKEVHARDVARAVELLLHAEDIAGEVYNCYDGYVADYEVATITRNVAESSSRITGRATEPKNQIDTDKLCALGMQFGGRALLERTIAEIVAALPQQ